MCGVRVGGVRGVGGCGGVCIDEWVWLEVDGRACRMVRCSLQPHNAHCLAMC